ncbi:MAG TPA: SUMF1/EgtB/PvdO family nonheme iron enzyme, partial [Planctomycetota bacterium]|nr:SUMF1/EgtB/PvdO family nonheme iron enzyme [Planctomycetota bacterium]
GLSEDERRRLSATAAELRRAVDERRTWTFDDGDIAMKHAVISKLIEAIEAAQAEGGSIARMRWRLQEANTLRARSVDAHAEAWQAAAEAVRTAPAYAAAVAAGLVLVPQTGLVPLGADPLSGLQEFAVLQTGAPPSRKEDGTLAITEDSALVLVLLPGGAFKMGAAANGDANVDPAALDHEAPVHEVALAPFFLAKHEMTQAQWQRWTGQNPSYYFAGRLVGDRQRITPLNPVETITWYEAEEVLRQLGLELPTEAQWEYAARGGGSSIWIGGDTVADLRGRANFAAADSPPDWMPDRTFADGFLVHAPIEAVAGNGYGLHHMLGNVSEWCRDPYGSYSNPVRGGDGLRVIQPGLPRVHRGGSYRSSPDKIRITARADDPADARSESRGVRPARRLELP